MTTLAIDLFCGLGGWTDGLLAEGWTVLGFDIERHRYPKMIRQESARKLEGNAIGATRWADRPVPRLNEAWRTAEAIEGEWQEYPAQLVIQDVLTLHGSQFKDASLIVASPPCQAYSYRAMPWKRAKALPPPDNSLFEACFRIQREACEAAGRHIPMVVENVRGAQKWVGRARWNYGSFYLWGDVPALMPPASRLSQPKVPLTDGRPNNHEKAGYVRRPLNGVPRHILGDGIKQGGTWWHDPGSVSRISGSGSPARKAASAMIAKIPLPLARHVAAVFKPRSIAA